MNPTSETPSEMNILERLENDRSIDELEKTFTIHTNSKIDWMHLIKCNDDSVSLVFRKCSGSNILVFYDNSVYPLPETPEDAKFQNDNLLQAKHSGIERYGERLKFYQNHGSYRFIQRSDLKIC